MIEGYRIGGDVRRIVTECDECKTKFKHAYGLDGDVYCGECGKRRCMALYGNLIAKSAENR